MIRITDILDKVSLYGNQDDMDLIDRAYIFSAQVHAGQVRLSGEPYLSHPLEVASLLADMKLDGVSISAGLLHDVLEDTHASEEQILDIFGKEVLHIVAGVTKLSTLPVGGAKVARKAENFRKMFLAMNDDIRVILIKLADRLHNMRTLKFHKSLAKQQLISQETMDIYAPIAARLGIYWIKTELENIAFYYLDRDEYERIERLVATEREQREEYIETVRDLIRQKIEAYDLACEVSGRFKNYYSIYQKMQSQDLAFDEIYDLIAFRIILDSVPHCYEALGIIHSVWKPVDTKFKDYIGRPKPNMYQSLHTTVVGPGGERMEVQIRTREMDTVANSGIAAHWSYKEGERIDENATRTYAWIQDLVSNNENIQDPKEFLENVRIDLFPDEVYVFTPQGEVLELPKGATPVDFAYKIHTEVGHHCVGAKVNSRMVPLKYELQTGDRVEIITAKDRPPSKDWLGFVQTVKARSKIRQWIKSEEKERSVSLGREMCDKVFRKYKLNFNALCKSDEMRETVAHFGFKTLDDLIASVGYGKITPLKILRRFENGLPEEEKPAGVLDKILGRVGRGQRKKPKDGVTVQGMDDVLVKFGKCCQPVPGDSIVGYITRGQGVTIHRTSCVHALRMNPDRKIEVEWADELPSTYPVKVRLRSRDRVGLLADVTALISKSEANIITANTVTNENQTVETYFTMMVKDTDHLSRLLKALREVRSVVDVKRLG